MCTDVFRWQLWEICILPRDSSRCDQISASQIHLTVFAKKYYLEADVNRWFQMK